MDPLSDSELRVKRAYRRLLVLLGAIVLVVSIWLIAPHYVVDLRFLSRFRLHREIRSPDYVRYVVDSPMSDIQKELDSHLLGRKGWSKAYGVAPATGSIPPRSVPADVTYSFGPHFGLVVRVSVLGPHQCDLSISGVNRQVAIP